MSTKKPRGMRRLLGDALISVVAIGVVLFALAAVDERVRTQIAQQIVAHPAAAVATSGATVRDAVSVVAVAVHDQSLAHAPLATFALASAVLVIFMLRT